MLESRTTLFLRYCCLPCLSCERLSLQRDGVATAQSEGGKNRKEEQKGSSVFRRQLNGRDESGRVRRTSGIRCVWCGVAGTDRREGE